MLLYPVTLSRDDNDTWVVDFPDFPEAHTFGETQDEALARAKDALATVIDAYVRDRRPIPAPTPTTGPTVELTALVSAKVDLYRVLHAQHVKKTDLANRLQWHLPQVDRLLDIHHASRLDQLEAAARAVGKRLVVSFEDEQPIKERLASREIVRQPAPVVASAAPGRRAIIHHRAHRKSGRKR